MDRFTLVLKTTSQEYRCRRIVGARFDLAGQSGVIHLGHEAGDMGNGSPSYVLVEGETARLLREHLEQADMILQLTGDGYIAL